MITDDQVVELFAQANPIPTREALAADSVVELGADESTSERSRTMVTVQPEQQEKVERRRPLLVGALGVALAVIIGLLVLISGQSDVAAPPSAEEQAIQKAHDFFAALTRGDVDGAMALMAPEVAEHEFNRTSVEFFAALPGTKSLSQCTGTASAVSCLTHFSGPLMTVTASDSSSALFTFENGLLTVFTPDDRSAAAEAFAQYASHVDPERYEQACSPESYALASVRTVRGAGFAFAGPCGELWAEVAEDAAAWVEAGKPPLTEDS